MSERSSGRMTQEQWSEIGEMYRQELPRYRAWFAYLATVVLARLLRGSNVRVRMYRHLDTPSTSLLDMAGTLGDDEADLFREGIEQAKRAELSKTGKIKQPEAENDDEE